MLKLPNEISARGIIELALIEYDLQFVNKHFEIYNIDEVKKAKDAALDLRGARFITWNSYIWFTHEFIMERGIIEFYIHIVYKDKSAEEFYRIEQIAAFNYYNGTIIA